MYDEFKMSEKSGPNSGPELIEQKHGGALLSGGVPGNKGGGRYPDRIKQILQEGMFEAAPSIVQLAKGGEHVSAGDQISAFDKLGKYGVGEAKTNTGDDLLNAAADALLLKDDQGCYLVPEPIQEAIMRAITEKLKG